MDIEKNTLLIWTADNGGLSGRRADSPYGKDVETANWPLFYGKNDAYEGGHRVPTLVAWGAHQPDHAPQKNLSLIPGRTETLSLGIWSRVQLGDDAGALALCAASFVLAFGSMLLAEGWLRRTR